jgi:hypothetical protein
MLSKNLAELLKSIEGESPDCPGYGGGKWAMYSIRCCWWTSFPDDLGSTKDFPRPELKPEYEKHIKDHGLPCCPHCGSVLMQAPLKDFMDQARNNPGHYGADGFAAFLRAHSRGPIGKHTCSPDWARYNLLDRPLRFA